MHPKPRWFSYGWRVVALSAVFAPVILWSQAPRCEGQGCSFVLADRVTYAQHLFGVTSSFLKSPLQGPYVGGVVVLQNGDVIAAECETSVTRLHRFTASSTYTDPVHGTTLHSETISDPIPGGCGIALHPDGYVYSNMFEGTLGSGVARIDLARLCWGAPGSEPPAGCSSNAVVKMGPPGNALGIAVDPIAFDPADPLSHRIVYAGQGCKPAFGPPPCTLVELDRATGLPVNLITLDREQFQYIDGLAFDPTGEYLFLTNRLPTFDLVVMKRTAGTFVVVQKVPVTVPTTTTEPVGLGFHAASPRFVLTNNVNGTITRFDFLRDDYTVPPTQSEFAREGSRGDLMQAGPDGCLYVTQDRSRYDDDEPGPFPENSIVQICDGFAPPAGVKPNDPPPPSSFCGFVYNDADNDGVRDQGEPAIPGVAITLDGRDRLGRVVPPSATTTAADGAYCFNNLRAGTYTIQEGLTPGYLDGKDTRGTPAGAGTTENDRFRNIVLDAGVQGQNNNFGELLPSSLCGYVYVDADNNGVRVSGEAGIGGAAVSLTGTDDLGAAVNMPTATGADGAYCFMGLRPGSYTITETQPAAYIDGKDTQGTPGTGTTGNDVFSNILLNQNVNGRDNNFGEMVPETDIPTCTLEYFKGPPYKVVMRFYDSGSGIVKLEITDQANMNVVLPTFTAPSPGPLMVTGTRIDATKSSRLTVKATDFFGNAEWCDPIVTTITKLRQDRGVETYTNIPDIEHVVTIINDEPGLRRLDVIVNGVTFAAKRLQDNEIRVIDIESAMREGSRNTITLVPRGRRGESALVTIADR